MNIDHTYEKDTRGDGTKKKYFTILGVAKYVESVLGGKIFHKSKSGSVYVKINSGEIVRISDHEVLSRNPDNINGTVKKADFEIYPNDRHGFEYNKTIKDVEEIHSELKEHVRENMSSIQTKIKLKNIAESYFAIDKNIKKKP